MTLKTLILKIVIIVGILITFYVVILYFSVGSVETDISQNTPYVEVVDKTYSTRQLCYLDNDALIGEKNTTYSLRIKTDGKPEYYIKIPIGTKMQIKKAISSYSPVSGYTSEYLEGTVYIKEIDKEVKFHYSWRDKIYSSDKKYYYAYELAPWQDKAMPFKFDLEGNKLPYNKESEDKLLKAHETYWKIYHKADPNLKHIYDIDSVSHLSNVIELFYKFNYFTNAVDNFDGNTSNKSFCLTNEEITFLNLSSIYNDLENVKIFPLSKFDEFKVFHSFLFAYVVENKVLETRLINFNNNYEIIDHIVIYQLIYNSKKPRIYTTGIKIQFDERDYNIKGKNIVHQVIDTQNGWQTVNTIFKIEDNGKITRSKE